MSERARERERERVKKRRTAPNPEVRKAVIIASRLRSTRTRTSVYIRRGAECTRALYVGDNICARDTTTTSATLAPQRLRNLKTAHRVASRERYTRFIGNTADRRVF